MKPTILIIDDEVKFTEGLKKILEKEYHVICAFSGKEGLAALKKESVDLVLLDYRLPDIDGIEVLKKIRSDFPDLPVIVMSGYGSQKLVIEAWEEKADFYMGKPLDLEKLFEKIEGFAGDAGYDPFLEVDIKMLSSPVRRVVKAVRKRPHKLMRLIDIANVISMSPDYLSSLFRKETGVRLKTYLVVLKIEKAKEMLSDERLSVKTIGFNIGFNIGFGSLSTFYRAFKNINGLTPAEYRLRLN